jgi:hypothetical protein
MFGRHRASRFEKQALELGGHVRKGEAGELVVYANSITRTETDAKGEETERRIPFMKGYTCSTPSSETDCPRITPTRQSPCVGSTSDEEVDEKARLQAKKRLAVLASRPRTQKKSATPAAGRERGSDVMRIRADYGNFFKVFGK